MRTILQAFDWYVSKEDRLWNTIADEAQMYKELGFTDVWLPPAYKAKYGDDDAGYGVYDLYDMGEFNQKGSVNTKYGSEKEYAHAVETLNSLGMGVIADIVLNHKLGADDVETTQVISMNEFNRKENIERLEIKAWTKFLFEGRGDVYSNFKWHKDHFTSVDFDQNTGRKGLFKFVGKEWDQNIDLELGNYDYLMGADVDFNNPAVIEEYMNWGTWYTDKYNFSGVRLDAVKHISFEFFPKWLAHLRKNQSLLAIGEYWSSDLRALSNYLMETEYSMMLFDVPLHFNLFDASQQRHYYDLRDIFKNTLVLNQPQFALTFVDNHDTQTGQSLQSMIEPWFRESANALVLLRETGIPCVFRPDLHDEGIRKIIKLRQHAHGLMSDMLDEEHCIAWSFINDVGLTVLISNHESYLKKIFVGVHHAGKTFKDALGNCDEVVVIDSKGIGMFRVNKESVSAYTLEGKIYESVS